MASFDSNIWYQMTEVHVGFGSVLTNWGSDLTGFQYWNSSNHAQYWQIMSAQDDSSVFTFRNNASGPLVALGVASIPQETDPSHTEPRLQQINPNDNGQKWRMGSFGNNTFYIVNVENGSSYHLDVHPGNPVYMSSQISVSPYDPRQHWEFQSIAPIDDSQWSQQPVTSMPTATASGSSVASATTGVSPSSIKAQEPHAGLSGRDYVVIGVGSAFVVIFGVAVSIFLILKRRARQKAKGKGNVSCDRLSTILRGHSKQVQEVSAEQTLVELQEEERSRVELSGGGEKLELPNSPCLSPVELPTSTDPRT